MAYCLAFLVGKVPVTPKIPPTLWAYIFGSIWELPRQLAVGMRPNYWAVRLTFGSVRRMTP